MKLIVLLMSVLALVVLAQSKGLPEEVQALTEDNPMIVQQFVEHVIARMDPDVSRLAEEGFQIPFLTRTCTNDACREICNILGFRNGECISAVTCQCS